jgi:hypothetical protein
MRWGPRREEAGCWVPWVIDGEGCDTMTSGNASCNTRIRPHSLPKLNPKESADAMVTQTNRCTSNRPTQPADSRADCNSAQCATGLKQ